MDNRIRNYFRQLIRKFPDVPKKVLEVAPPKRPDKSLLCIPELEGVDACGINITGPFNLKGIPVYKGNANDMNMFTDASFDLILTNALLEHDAYFWKTLSECKRLLQSGGRLIIGVPGFASNVSESGNSTKTYKYHMKEDYYRFSPLAVETVFLDGLVDLSVHVMLDPPRIIGLGRKV